MPLHRSLHARHRLKLPSATPDCVWRVAGKVAGVLKDIQRGQGKLRGASTLSLHTKGLLHAPRPSFAARSSFLTPLRLTCGELIVMRSTSSASAAEPSSEYFQLTQTLVGGYVRSHVSRNSELFGVTRKLDSEFLN
jgi:hypothetical protein